jgi:ketosteroid isomerase-like protein
MKGNRIVMLIISLAIVISFTTVSHSEKNIIAIYDFTPVNVPAQYSKTCSEWIQTAMANSPFTVIERSQLKKVLGEVELQMSGLVDQEGAVKVGKMLSANKVMIGSLSKIGGKYVLDGRIVDVEKGTAEYGQKEFTWQEGDLDVCVQRYVDNILFKMTGRPVAENRALIVKAEKASEDTGPLERERVEKTIRTLYDAYVNRDLDAYLSVVDDDARFWCSAYDLKGRNSIKAFRSGTTFRLLDNFSYTSTDMKIEIQGAQATVWNTYSLTFRVIKTGKMLTEKARERFLLVKKGNSWYIKENQEY